MFRAYDPELQRQVAVKVARPSRDGFAGGNGAISGRGPACGAVEAREHRAGSRRWPRRSVALYRLRPARRLRSRRHVRLRRMPVAESAQIVARVADALECAHRNGLVHRDVKPANILLDREGNVFLTDFGIAVTREQLEDGAIPVEGTLAYMAPEQLVPTGRAGGPAERRLQSGRGPLRTLDGTASDTREVQRRAAAIDARSVDSDRNRRRLPAGPGGSPHRAVCVGG